MIGTLNSPPLYKEVQGNLEGESSSLSEVTWAIFQAPIQLYFLIFLFILQVYVLKRPHVDEFLKRMGELFECVLFTASLAKVCNKMFLFFLV